MLSDEKSLDDRFNFLARKRCDTRTAGDTCRLYMLVKKVRLLLDEMYVPARFNCHPEIYIVAYCPITAESSVTNQQHRSILRGSFHC